MQPVQEGYAAYQSLCSTLMRNEQEIPSSLAGFYLLSKYVLTVRKPLYLLGVKQELGIDPACRGFSGGLWWYTLVIESPWSAES